MGDNYGYDSEDELHNLMARQATNKYEQEEQNSANKEIMKRYNNTQGKQLNRNPAMINMGNYTHTASDGKKGGKKKGKKSYKKKGKKSKKKSKKSYKKKGKKSKKKTRKSNKKK